MRLTCVVGVNVAACSVAAENVPARPWEDRVKIYMEKCWNFNLKFKWPLELLNFVKIKNPFESLQTNPQAIMRSRLYFFVLKKFFLEQPNVQNY